MLPLNKIVVSVQIVDCHDATTFLENIDYHDDVYLVGRAPLSGFECSLV